MKNKMTFWNKVGQVARGSVEEWLAQHAASKGAALAFYSLFSMAPIIVLGIAIAGSVFGAEAVRGELFLQLKGLVGTSGAQALQALIENVHRDNGGPLATAIAGVVLLVGATTAFSELKESLDQLWHVPPVQRTGIMNLIRTRLLSFGVVLMLAFLLLISLVISAILAVLEQYWNGLWRESVQLFAWLASAVSFLIIASLFGIIYKVLPQAQLAWRDVIIGALGTAALFTVGKYGIGLYLGNSAIASSYGAAGSLIALLMWVYYSAQIFFFGAVFTRQYAMWFGGLAPPTDAKTPDK